MVQDHISQISYGTWAFASSESGSKPPCGNRRRATPNATCLGTSTLPQQNNPFFLGHFTYLYIIMYIYIVYVFGTSSTAIIASFGENHYQWQLPCFFLYDSFFVREVFFASPSDSGWNRDHKWPEQITPEVADADPKRIQNSSIWPWNMPVFFGDALNATKSY